MCVEDGGRGVSHRMSTNWCKALSQPLKYNSLTPHEALDLAKMQAASDVAVRQVLPLELEHETALQRINCFFI